MCRPSALSGSGSTSVILRPDTAAQYKALSHPSRPHVKGAFDLQHLPWCAVETSFRQGKARKAPGPGQLPDWLWRASPQKAAELWLPVFLKTHVRLSEPVQFKSTLLCSLFKGKGSPTQLSNYRAIALMMGPGKVLRKEMREVILSQLPGDPLHQGGIPHSLLQGAHHVVRVHATTAAALKVSSCAIFLDVSSAYYRVLRQSFAEGIEDDGQVCAILQPCIWCVMLAGTNLMEGAPEHAQLLLREFLAGSFFVMKEGGPVTLTRAGTRPGDSIADALFSLLQADFLAGLRQRMEALDLLEDPVTCQAFERPRLLAPVWADDTSILLAHAGAEGILTKTQVVLAQVHTEFERRGMLPNYSRGKSEPPGGRGHRPSGRHPVLRYSRWPPADLLHAALCASGRVRV